MDSGTIVRGGTVVTPAGTRKLDIVIEGGRIVALAEHAPSGSGADEIDATGLIVLPGGVDGHSHFILSDPATMVPDLEEFEGMVNGGSAAVAGGITTCVEMAQSDPPATTAKRVARKRELGAKDAIVDFALLGGVTGDQTEQDILDQVAEGVVGFKAYMADSDPTFPGIGDARLVRTLEALRPHGIMLGLHAENHDLLMDGLRRMTEAGRTDPMAHAESRPPVVEIEAVNRAIFYAEYTDGWAHIVHMSTPGAAELIRRAKARGIKITCETCPHYLVLDLDDLRRLGPYARCAPAIRDRALVEQMWEYVADGTIDAIASDHCGYTVESKESGRENIFTAPNGLTAIQTLLPVLITEGRRRGLSWDRIAELFATVPARLWQVDDRKGSIAIGLDADLALVDPDREWVLTADDLLHTHKWSPYEGQTFKGRVVRTLIRGVTVFRDDLPERIQVQPGFGQWLPARAGHD